MDDLMKCLYDFVQANRMGSLRDNEEYKEYTKSTRLQKARVEACLNEDQKMELSQLIDVITCQDSIAAEHLFQAALGLARELNALVN